MDYLAAIGRAKADIEQAATLQTPLESFMIDVGNMFTNLMREHIDEQGANAGFALRQGLLNRVTTDATGAGVEFTSEEDYAEFRNAGVSGTETQRDTPFSFKTDKPSKAMAQSIAEWLRAKGYIANEWAVATNVLKHGYEGARFIERAFSDDNLNGFEEGLLTLTEQFVTNKFEKIIPNLR